MAADSVWASRPADGPDGQSLLTLQQATAFSVTRPFSVFRFIFTVASSVSATYPIQGELQFSDGSRLQVINESLAPQAGPGRQWDAPAVPGKTVSQVTFRIGPSHDPAASGFTYRIAVQGCD